MYYHSLIHSKQYPLIKVQLRVDGRTNSQSMISDNGKNLH